MFSCSEGILTRKCIEGHSNCMRRRFFFSLIYIYIYYIIYIMYIFSYILDLGDVAGASGF